MQYLNVGGVKAVEHVMPASRETVMGIVTQLKRTRIVQIAHLLIAAGTECATAKKTAITVRLIVVGNPLQWKQIVMTISIMMGMALPTVMIRIVPVIPLAATAW